MFLMIPVAILVIGALFTLAFKRDWIGIGAVIASSVALGFILLSSAQKVFTFGGWKPPYGIVWILDPFSIFFALTAMGITSLVVIYSIKYIREGSERAHRYYALLCLLSMGMIGVSLTGDIFNLYVFFEIMSIASYGLVAFFDDRNALEGAFKYLLTGSFASSFILIAIAMIYGLTGTLNMADIASKILHLSNIPGIYIIPLGLAVAGFGLKAAMFPFHAWKPDAIEGTPAPVGALFTAASSAIGIYCMIRLLFLFGLLQTNWILIILGMITMVIGALLAFMQNDIKRLLAYSSISQVGYILIAFGLGTLAGFTAGTYHILNNAITEGILFMSFGVALHVIKKEKIGQVSVKNDFLLISSLIGILALTGIPLTNGFVSKWLIYLATWKVSPLITLLTLVVSGLTFAYSVKLFSAVFLSPGKRVIKVPLTMKIPICILLILCIIIGLFPHAGMMIAENASIALLNLPEYVTMVLG